MAHPSLRKLRVALYDYQSETDPDTGVTQSVYVRRLSSDPSGLWWASRGIVFGRETAPAMQPQEEETSFWSFGPKAPVSADGLIVQGTFVNGEFSLTGKQVYRVQSVMDRNTFRGGVQVYATHVDDADATIVLEESESFGAFSSGFSSGFA